VPPAPPPAPPGTRSVDAAEVAGRLRYAVLRLARLLRQQDAGGTPPALLAALAVVEREGLMTLGELARQEQVTPPTITKVVAALEQRGLVERVRDERDARVTLVRATARGRRQLEATRARRTAWLATQLDGLDAGELARIAAALDALETITRVPERP